MNKLLVSFLMTLSIITFAMTSTELDAHLKSKQYNSYAEIKADAKSVSDFITFIRVINWKPGYEKYLSDLNKDSELTFKNKFYFTKGITNGKLPNDTNWVLDNVVKFFKLNLNDKPQCIKNMNYALAYLEKNAVDCDKEKLMATLKKLNIQVYPKIGQSENFKQIATRIQLLMKAIE